MADDLDDDGEFSQLSVKVADSTSKLSTGASGFGRAITHAFASGIAGGKQFDEILRSLGTRLSELSLKAAFKPLEQSISKGIEKLFAGVLGASGGARDGGLGGTSISPFADGGVIASPHYFPLGPGRMGLAGEAGPEAILPLARGSDGRLGVASGAASPPSVTINISTQDAASFRQSEVYVAGMLARAVGRGQRGL